MINTFMEYLDSQIVCVISEMQLQCSRKMMLQLDHQIITLVKRMQKYWNWLT